MKSFLVLGFLAPILSGCAAFGTKTKFNAEAPISTIRHVAFTTSRVALPAGVTAQQADSVFVEEVAAKLAVATGWKVTYIGEADAVISHADELLSNNSYQAIVHAELLLKSYGVLRGIPRYNAWTRMQIFKFPEKQLIGESHFNTLMGKTYSLHPELSVAIRDGVDGLITPWQKRVQSPQ
jgi:hypothetical protein